MWETELMPHNRKTLEEIEYYIREGKDCCVVNPCGSGKTSVMSAFIKRHMDSTFVVLTKQGNAADYYRSRDNVFRKDNVKIATYSKMLADYKKGRIDRYDAQYLLIDEAHYIGAEKWSKAFELIHDMYDPFLIGFTATPQRYEDQGTVNTIVKRYFGGNTAGNYTSKHLQMRGVFTEPEYVLSIHDLEETVRDRMEKVESSEADKYEKSRIRALLSEIVKDWKKNACPQKVMRTHLPGYMYKEACNRILVYVQDTKCIPERSKEIGTIVRGIFPGKEVKEYSYTFRDPKGILEQFLEEDETYIKIMYSVDRIMETVHIDDLKIVIMLRPSVSDRIIVQQFGRVNSIGNKNRALIIDMVDNLSNLGSTTCVSGLKRHLSSGSQKKGDSKLHWKTIKYISQYEQIFAETDMILKKCRKYTYRGFTGTLKTVCEVYERQYEDVVRLMETDDFFSAMEETGKNARIRYPSRKTRDRIYGTELSEEDAAYARENIQIYLSFAEDNVSDEDMKQDVYFCYLRAVGATSGKSERKMRIISLMRSYYLTLAKNSAREKALTDTQEIPCIIQKDICEWDEFRQVGDRLGTVIETLKEREQRCVCLYYGMYGEDPHTLDEISEIFQTNRENVRQILAKALRKMRHPSRSRAVKDSLMYYDMLTDQPNGMFRESCCVVTGSGYTE